VGGGEAGETVRGLVEFRRNLQGGLAASRRRPKHERRGNDRGTYRFARLVEPPAPLAVQVL
jgi:hypothetical protein